MDRYGDTLVAQFTSAGTERWKEVIADALLQHTGLTRLYERSDASVRQLEGLESSTGWLRGGPAEGGEAPPLELEIHEHQWRLTLNIAEGHKTGFYLDQRDSRKRFADSVQRLRLRRVLNCYCYTGVFGGGAGRASARPAWRMGEVVSIDSSGPALERARAHGTQWLRCGARATFLDADVNASLRQFLRKGALTPSCSTRPSLPPPPRTPPSAPPGPTKDINRLALQLLEPGGCCSPSRARAASALTCSTRSWPRPGPTRGGRLHPGAPGRGAGPSDDAGVSRGRISQGLVVMRKP